MIHHRIWRPTRRVAAVLCSAAVAAVACTGTAVAASGSPQDLASRYASLAGALIESAAKSQDQQLLTYLNGPGMADAARMGAIDPRVLAEAIGTGDLDAAAAATAGLSLVRPDGSPILNPGSVIPVPSDPAFAGMEALAAQIREKAGLPDAQLTAAGAQWATELAGLTVPELVNPELPTQEVPKEALAIGLMVTKTTTAMAKDHPKSFTGRPKGASVPQWSGAMRSAGDAVKKAGDSGLFDPCSAAMYVAMASGDRSQAAKIGGSGCSPCITAGMYGHSIVGYLANPALARKVTATGPGGNVTSAYIRQMPGWLSQGMTNADGQTLSQAAAMARATTITNAGAGMGRCGTADLATGRALTQGLPGAFASLSGQ